MKAYLAVIIAALLLLPGCGEPKVHHPPMPLVASFDGPGRFITAAEAEAMPDWEMDAFLSGSLSMNGIRSREDVIYMASKMEACPLPLLDGFKLSGVSYYTEREDLFIRYGSEEITVSFEVDLNPGSKGSRAKAPFTAKLIYEDAEAGAKVYSLGYESPSYEFLVLKDGYSFSASVFHTTKSIARDIMQKCLSFTNMAAIAGESLWIDEEEWPQQMAEVSFEKAEDYVTRAEAEAMPEEELEALISDMSFIFDRTDLIRMTSNIEACPIPTVEGFRLTKIEYHPDYRGRSKTILRIYYDRGDTRVYFSTDVAAPRYAYYVSQYLQPHVTELISEDIHERVYAMEPEAIYSPFLLRRGEHYFLAKVYSPEETALKLMKDSLGFTNMASLASDKSLWLKDE